MAERYPVDRYGLPTGLTPLPMPPVKPPRKEAVTGHTEEKKTPEAIRKEQQRERERELGILPVEVKLGPREREQLANGCKVRGGVRGAYEAAEYVATLIRRDAERLEAQLGDLAATSCGQCGKALPQGCGGVWRGENACWHTHGARDLEL